MLQDAILEKLKWAVEFDGFLEDLDLDRTDPCALVLHIFRQASEEDGTFGRLLYAPLRSSTICLVYLSGAHSRPVCCFRLAASLPPDLFLRCIRSIGPHEALLDYAGRVPYGGTLLWPFRFTF